MMLTQLWVSFLGKKVIINPCPMPAWERSSDRLAVFWAAVALVHRVRLIAIERWCGGTAPLAVFLVGLVAGLVWPRFPWVLALTVPLPVFQFLLLKGYSLGNLGSPEEREQLDHIVRSIPLELYATSRSYYDQLWEAAYREGMP